ncbi:MAG: NUDIX hydrolase [Faecousia sp.]
MSSIGKIAKKVGSRFLSYYELEAVHRDGSVSPYYMASRNPDPNTLKAVTHENKPDGVVIYSLYQDKVVLVRQYRYPIGGFIYEFPAGLVEPGEEMEQAAIREMYEETGLTLTPIPCGSYGRPFFTTVGMTDESCGTVFGRCTGEPTSRHQESTEEIQVVLADRAECRRILKEENVSIMCAYMLMHFIAGDSDPFQFLKVI